MKVSKIVVAPFLALALLSTAACGSEPTSCPRYEVLERDEDGAECEPDENENGIDDENEGLTEEEPAEAEAEEEDSDKDKKRKPRRRK